MVNYVITSNLNPNDFAIGTEIANLITIAMGAGLVRDAAGVWSVDPAYLASNTTNALTSDGVSVITTTVNGVPASLDLAPLIAASETVTSLAFNAGTNSLEYTDEAGTVNAVAIPAETLTTLAYNGATGELTYTDEAGAPTVLNLPLENFLSAASFDAASDILTLTLTDGTTIPVDLGDLLDAYSLTVSNSDNVALTLTGDGSTATPWNIEAAVVLDPLAGNLLTSSAAGLLVDPANFPPTTNTLVNDGANTLTSTVDGVVASAPIVNTVALAPGATAGSLVSTVNGVASTEQDLGVIVRPLADLEMQDAFGVTIGYAFTANV